MVTRFEIWKEIDQEFKEALSPATKAFQCGCGKPDCWLGRVRPLREHLAEVYKIANLCIHEDIVSSAASNTESSWDGVAYHIQMAASLDGLKADTAYTDDSGSYLYCDSVDDFENAHSESASKYMAALIIFNFLWSAYELAVKCSPGAGDRGKTGARARDYIGGMHVNILKMPLFPHLLELAIAHCRRAGDPDNSGIAVELKKLEAKYPKGTPDCVGLRAGEYLRMFRNHIAHGADKVPYPDDWGWGDDGCDPIFKIYRLYGASRLILLNIQLMLLASVEKPSDCLPDWEYIDKAYNGKTPEELLLGAHLVRA